MSYNDYKGVLMMIYVDFCEVIFILKIVQKLQIIQIWERTQCTLLDASLLIIFTGFCLCTLYYFICIVLHCIRLYTSYYNVMQ